MNRELLLIGSILLLVVVVVCMSTCTKETFTKLYKDNNFAYYVSNDPSLLSAKTHQYTFLPQRMENVIGLGKRGCESAKYWECVHRDPNMKAGGNISSETHAKCVKSSDEKCFFPERMAQSRTDPYYMYLNYA